MFTGLIKSIGTVADIIHQGTNTSYIIRHDLGEVLQIDESIAHDGVCLTVERIMDECTYQVTAIEETLNKTNLGKWSVGQRVNLERAVMLNARLGGHIVQGHIDTVATCISREDRDGSYTFRFQIEDVYAALVIEKGSITLNGISLTIFDVSRDAFSVAIIPYTYQHTTMHLIDIGSVVNVEFDILGKYILRRESLQDSC